MMRALLAGLVGAFGAAATPAGAGPVVTVEGGRIEGTTLADGRLAFRAVPFAAPPIGRLRWRPPEAVRPWSGVRPAVSSAPSCPQLSDGWNAANAAFTSEDCLFLEVSTATLRPSHPMPVIVWIHGGSNKAGGAAGAIESSLSAKGVVLVSIQYRLGALGFMAHPALTAESPWHASGNWGLMDQQAALRWVQRNIARFGGDPGNVTIAGESAGAQDVGLQMLSPLARSLFAKAIEESGTAAFGYPSRDLATSEHYGERIAHAAGVPDQSAEALRALPVSAILRAERSVHFPALIDDGMVWLQATVDGHVLPADPKQLFESGQTNPAPLIIGSNAREIGLFDGNDAGAAAGIRRAFGPAGAQAIIAYGLDGSSPPPPDPRLGSAAMRAATDIIFRCPASYVAADRARAGQPVWQYEFDYDADGIAVSHAAELRAVFSAPGEGKLPTDAPPMQAFWLNFAFTGNPNGTGLPFWPAFDLHERSYVRFTNAGVQQGEALGRSTCAWLQRP